jgi:hypothetical protein
LSSSPLSKSISNSSNGVSSNNSSSLKAKRRLKGSFDDPDPDADEEDCGSSGEEDEVDLNLASHSASSYGQTVPAFSLSDDEDEENEEEAGRGRMPNAFGRQRNGLDYDDEEEDEDEKGRRRNGMSEEDDEEQQRGIHSGTDEFSDVLMEEPLGGPGGFRDESLRGGIPETTGGVHQEDDLDNFDFLSLQDEMDEVGGSHRSGLSTSPSLPSAPFRRFPSAGSGLANSAPVRTPVHNRSRSSEPNSDNSNNNNNNPSLYQKRPLFSTTDSNPSILSSLPLGDEDEEVGPGGLGGGEGRGYSSSLGSTPSPLSSASLGPQQGEDCVNPRGLVRGGRRPRTGSVSEMTEIDLSANPTNNRNEKAFMTWAMTLIRR